MTSADRPPEGEVSSTGAQHARPVAASLTGASGTAASAPGHPAAVRNQRIALVDLLDRVLARGVVAVGDVTLSIADVDLVTISLRALVSSATAADLVPGLPGGGPDRTGGGPHP
jgi:Gas vesicle protein